MKIFNSFVVAGFVVGWTVTGRGSIEDFKQLTIDFTNATTAAKAATWSTPDKLTVSKDGLGWEGEAAGVHDGWIQTKPLALGLSWRTPSAVSVRVTIQPPPREIALNNGTKTSPYAGDVYVRYSPDLKHWSSFPRSDSSIRAVRISRSTLSSSSGRTRPTRAGRFRVRTTG